MQMFDACEYEGNDRFYGYSALPATKIAPEKMASQKGKDRLPTMNFQGYARMLVSGRVFAEKNAM